jgi:hypothetical protein
MDTRPSLRHVTREVLERLAGGAPRTGGAA